MYVGPIRALIGSVRGKRAILLLDLCRPSRAIKGTNARRYNLTRGASRASSCGSVVCAGTLGTRIGGDRVGVLKRNRKPRGFIAHEIAARVSRVVCRDVQAAYDSRE